MIPTISSNAEIQSYFETLPKSVQETVKQSGACFQSLQQLQALARHLAGRETVG